MQNRKTQTEQGFALLELLASLPMLALLLVTIAGLFLYGMKLYYRNLADVELQQELQTAMSQIVDDLTETRAVEQLPGGQDGVMLAQRYDPSSGRSNHRDTYVTYRAYTVPRTTTRKLYYGSDFGAPMMGNHALAGVTITEFFCSPDSDKIGLVHLRLSGKSEVTKHEYTLKTTIYLPTAP